MKKPKPIKLGMWQVTIEGQDTEIALRTVGGHYEGRIIKRTDLKRLKSWCEKCLGELK